MKLVQYFFSIRGRQLFSAILVVGIVSYFVLFKYDRFSERGCSCEKRSKLRGTTEDNSSTTHERAQLRDFWRPVSKKYKLYVYSAFYDYSLPDRVRIVGVMPTNNKVQPCCLVHCGNITVRSRADIVNINEEHGKRYTAAYFLCATQFQVPETVQLFVDEFHKATLQVHVISHHKHRQNFTICLSPFHTKFRNPARLIEWIELNSMFGVTYFTFYNFSLSLSVSNVLNYYVSIGKADVLTWNVDTVDDTLLFSDKVLHYYGQLGALNDCLFRNKQRSHYIAVLDVDELIVPRQKQYLTWRDMFSNLPKSSVYVFRNVFFMKSHDSISSNQSLTIHNMLHRESTIRAIAERTKVIVNTADALILGIHEVWGLKSGSVVHQVDPSIGLLHHYRDVPVSDFSTEIVKDTTMDKYSMIKYNVDETVQNMKSKAYLKYQTKKEKKNNIN